LLLTVGGGFDADAYPISDTKIAKQDDSHD